jgi:aerobic-type carbon monoxide dehydrogenase small subunit (CoxS/CutS family)
MSIINLHVNGVINEIEANLDTPLIFVLRNHLNLTGPKLGCGQEQCGACVVLVDGEATNSCVRAASEFEGQEIITIEGLSQEGVLNTVQKAFINEGAAQCGYCTSGIIIAVTALINKNPQPTREDVDNALHDHLCRCGSHNQVLNAIESLLSKGSII